MDRYIVRLIDARRDVLALFLVWIATPSLAQEPQVLPTKAGYLFVDGQYFPPPYVIKREDGLITINDQKLTKSDLGAASNQEHDGLARAQRAPAERGPGRMGRLRGRKDQSVGKRDPDYREFGSRRYDDGGYRFKGPRGRGGFSRLEQLADQIEQVVFGAIVVIYRGEKPAVLFPTIGGHELLLALVGESGEDMVGPPHASAEDQALLNRLVSEFQSSEVFLTRATRDLDEIRRATDAGDRVSAANMLVAQISYPLTVFAMVIVVLGFGHLLSNRPALDADSTDESKQREVVVKSLVIVALLSVVDLIWTLAATNAGTMRELNPLGSRFVEDPAHLVLFKVAVTGTSLGILYFLHRRPVAQVASWWCCLLLTLLTARWVVFQSMFL